MTRPAEVPRATLALAVALTLPACASRIDVPAQPRDGVRACWLPERFVAEADSPGLFVDRVACGVRPDDGVVHRFASATFLAVVGWDEVDCPEPDVDCPDG